MCIASSIQATSLLWSLTSTTLPSVNQFVASLTAFLLELAWYLSVSIAPKPRSAQAISLLQWSSPTQLLRGRCHGYRYLRGSNNCPFIQPRLYRVVIHRQLRRMLDNIGTSPSENMHLRCLQLVGNSILHFKTCGTCICFEVRLTLKRYLLIGAATSMGAVAIWCMHYVGNCAIQMLHGEQELQLEYRRSYTAGSFFLPICVLGLAFYYFNQSRAISLQEPILGGIVTGLAVLGMHYTAEIGISNYTISFSWKYILGSAAVAVAANIAALGIFFYVTKVWTNGLLKKLFCASLLAISVSGMHWVATVGTSYRFKRRSSSTRNDLSRQGAAVVVVCLVSFS